MKTIRRTAITVALAGAGFVGLGAASVHADTQPTTTRRICVFAGGQTYCQDVVVVVAP